MTTMRAVRLHDYGAPEVLQVEEVARPEPQAGQVLVRVGAAGVNPVDAAIRAGYLRNYLPTPPPFIPGGDIAGEVAALGPDVTTITIGTPVYAMLGLAGGGYAEYALVSAADLAHRPTTVDVVTAAALPLAGLTAWQALFDAGQLRAGQRVLIHAAAGGVGHLAVQLAKSRGAYVIGTASAKNFDMVHSLGADEVIDYTTTRFEDVTRDIDLVIVGVHGDSEARSYRVLHSGGRLVSLVGEPESPLAAEHNVQRVRMMVQPNSAQLTEMTKLIDAGKLRVIVQSTFGLDEAVTAHQQIETGRTRGKIVLRVS